MPSTDFILIRLRIGCTCTCTCICTRWSSELPDR